jgi:cell division inhibitor SulA
LELSVVVVLVNSNPVTILADSGLAVDPPTRSSLVAESSHLSSLPMHANSPLLQQPKRWPRRCAATRTPEHGSYNKRWWLTVCTVVLLSPLSSLIALDVSRSAMNPSNERLGIR